MNHPVSFVKDTVLQAAHIQLRSQYPIGMDFETWGSEPLPTVGLDNYLHAGEFHPLACAMVWQDEGSHENIVVFDFVKRPEDYDWYRQVLIDNGDYVHLAAHNADFERGVIGTMGLDPLKLHIIDTAVISRCMGAGSRLEAAAPQLLGIDIGREMVKHLSYEIAAETDRELIWKCKNVAVFGDGGQNGAVEVFNPDATITTNILHDKMISVANKIISLANEIHTATIRGAGNVVLVSPRVSTILQVAQNTSFKATNGTFETNNGNSLVEVGTLDHGKIKVYRDPWAYLDGGVDYALVGYKGGIDDAGVLFHPYLLNLVNTATNQQDFSTAIGVMSRYAITDSLLGSGRYYRYVEFADLAKLGV